MIVVDRSSNCCRCLQPGAQIRLRYLGRFLLIGTLEMFIINRGVEVSFVRKKVDRIFHITFVHTLSFKPANHILDCKPSPILIVGVVRIEEIKNLNNKHASENKQYDKAKAVQSAPKYQYDNYLALDGIRVVVLFVVH